MLPAPCLGQPWSRWRPGAVAAATVVATVGPATVVRQPLPSRETLWAPAGAEVHTPHFEPRRHSLSPVLRAQRVRPGLEVGWCAGGVGGRIMAAGGVGRNHEEMRHSARGQFDDGGFGDGVRPRRGRARLRWQDANAREP